MMDGNERALLVDDDTDLCALVKEYLEDEGFKLEVVHDGQSGLSRALSGEANFVILDVMLPKLNGLEVLKQIRASSAIPVLLLTARGSEVDRVLGLELGADDYLPKPFSPRELVARIRAILRRTAPQPVRAVDTRIDVGDVELDPSRHYVARAGKTLELTVVEFSVLATLLRSAGHIVTREDLSRLALGRVLSPFDRSIDVHVSNIRKKLLVAGGPDPIKTIRGVGYLYLLPNPAEAQD